MTIILNLLFTPPRALKIIKHKHRFHEEFYLKRRSFHPEILFPPINLSLILNLCPMELNLNKTSFQDFLQGNKFRSLIFVASD